MAKIIKRICFISILALFLIPISVFANELTIESADSVNPDETIECSIKGNFTDNVNSVKIRYEIPEGVEFSGFTASENWNIEQGGTAETTGLILRMDDSNVNGNVDFGKFTLKVPDGYSKETVDLKLYDIDATNTDCEIVVFDNQIINKEIIVSGIKNNQPGEEDNIDKDDKNEDSDVGSEDGVEDEIQDGAEDGKENGTQDDSNTDYGGNSNTGTDTDSDVNINTGTNDNPESGSSNIEENKENTQDSTATKNPFGQYGSKTMIILIICIALFISIRFYAKFKKIKFIK